MLDKDPQNQSLFVEIMRNAMPYLYTLFLAAWGGAVHHFQRLRAHKMKFRWRDFFIDIFICGFAGILTYLLCKSASINGAQAAFLIAISGHMGARAIAGLSSIYERVFPFKD